MVSASLGFSHRVYRVKLTYLHLAHGINKEGGQLLPQPLVPGTVAIHVFSRGREIKVSLDDEPKPVAPEWEEGKHLLGWQVLCRKPGSVLIDITHILETLQHYKLHKSPSLLLLV